VSLRALFVYCALFNLLKPTCYVMHQQFNIQQLYALPTLYLCFVFILCLSQEKWLQHVQRMDTNRLPKQALQYKPKGMKERRTTEEEMEGPNSS